MPLTATSQIIIYLTCEMLSRGYTGEKELTIWNILDTVNKLTLSISQHAFNGTFLL